VRLYRRPSRQLNDTVLRPSGDQPGHTKPNTVAPFSEFRHAPFLSRP
jgi:hypothetical protein